jgi:hypothetical protein
MTHISNPSRFFKTLKVFQRLSGKPLNVFGGKPFPKGITENL